MEHSDFRIVAESLPMMARHHFRIENRRDEVKIICRSAFLRILEIRLFNRGGS